MKNSSSSVSSSPQAVGAPSNATLSAPVAATTDTPRETSVLFASSEVYPLVKTGGLADVSGSLPLALHELGNDVRLLLPFYPQTLDAIGPVEKAGELTLSDCPEPVWILRGTLPGSDVPVYLADAPRYFRRNGGPYAGPEGRDWPDNAARFAAFSRIVVATAEDQSGLDWRPEVVHCNDWQTGLVPPLLNLREHRPATVFTIHNLAYQGLFPEEIYRELELPRQWWSAEALEFHGQVSFIKGGLIFGDWLTTVSPTYAMEIRTPAFGYGLEGLLRARGDRLTGILNGADYDQWDPRHDELLVTRYGPDDLGGKSACKGAVQAAFDLPRRPDTPLLAWVGRLVEQKGIDLVIEALPSLVQKGVQIVILGSGESRFESALRALAEQYTDRVGLLLDFDEPMAHRMTAGADMLLMPSRFEPCGLNQMYSLRYGTVPVVRRTGGLADTVVHALPRTIADHTATGFVFDEPSIGSLLPCVQHGLTLYHHSPETWRSLVLTGMKQDFSWTFSAQEYDQLYRRLVAWAGGESAVSAP